MEASEILNNPNYTNAQKGELLYMEGMRRIRAYNGAPAYMARMMDESGSSAIKIFLEPAADQYNNVEAMLECAKYYASQRQKEKAMRYHDMYLRHSHISKIEKITLKTRFMANLILS